jgi:hypothetical protein
MANRYMPFKWSDSPAINLTLRRGALPKPVEHAMMAKLTEVLMWWEKVPDTPAARKISAGAWQDRRLAAVARFPVQFPARGNELSKWMFAGNRPRLAKLLTMADIARSAIEVNSRAAHLGISMCRSELRRAGDRIAPCNSSPPWSANNSESCRRSRRTERRPSCPRFSWP